MTVFGVDIAGRSGRLDFQHGLSMAAVKVGGFRFVTARAVAFPGGTMAEDGDYAIFRDGADANGLLFAAYIMPHTNYSAAAQAQKLADVIGDKTIPVMIDWEQDGDWSIPSYSFAVDLRDECVGRGLRVATLYGPHWYWQGQGSPTLTGRAWRLVSSTYGKNLAGTATVRYANQGGATGVGWTAYGGLKPSIWQFGSKIQCGGMLVDGDAYEGTLTDLATSGMFKGDDSMALDSTDLANIQKMLDKLKTDLVGDPGTAGPTLERIGTAVRSGASTALGQASAALTQASGARSDIAAALTVLNGAIGSLPHSLQPVLAAIDEVRALVAALPGGAAELQPVLDAIDALPGKVTTAVAADVKIGLSKP